jgi:hypothetical protein
MPKAKVETFECSVCLSEGHTKQVYNCNTCKKELLCAKCVGILVEVCEHGCPCAKYRCPTCRQEVAFIVNNVTNPTLLQCINKRLRQHLSCDYDDEDAEIQLDV